VKRLVELHGGEISVTSVVGRGTCFSFTASFGVRAAAVRPRLDLDGARVLVVDDNEIKRLILRELLTREGGEVTEARSGAQALAELERALTEGRPYRLLLLDCRMPEMDGLEVARRVKSLYQHDTAQLPCLVMLTSDDLGGQLARLREIGVQSYLVKPVRRSELISTIARAMGEAAVAASAPAPSRDRIRPALHPLRILLADDSAVNRMLIRAFFDGTPWHLDEAEDGQAAVDKFKHEKFDLVLMDMRMPVADGYTATRSIRNWERENHLTATPIVALTASALEAEVRRCLEAGCDVHVSKPVRRATLLHMIEAVARGGPPGEGPSVTA
jgi:two-component system sensor histidine kinase/response regulator